MATVTKPLALNESLNSTENTPRNIADVLADELDGIKQAINSQSGSGNGHIIQNSSGANMPSENTMQFVDAHLSDDNVGGKTKVETFKAVTEAEYSSETEDGAYIITDGDGVKIRKNGQEYDVGVIPQSLYDDVEDLKEYTQSLKFPRQKNLGTFTTTVQLEAFLNACNVSTGTFDGDVQIGDYVTIAGYKCIVAGFDTEYNKGDTALTTHHITFLANFGNSKMNETNTTAGGYEGASTMQSFLSGKENELNAICSSHLLSRKVLTTNTVTNGKSSNWNWYAHKLTLMSETQVYGGIQWGNAYDTGEGYEKLPIFNYLTPLQVFGRTHMWLRGVDSATSFCFSSYRGVPGSDFNASDSLAAVALFCIG